jgi:hypothetical protein
MKHFNDWDDDSKYLQDEGPMIGGSERYEERKEKLSQAKEICSGIVSGARAGDEVIDLVKKIKDQEE